LLLKSHIRLRLSTPPGKRVRGHRNESRVVRTEDIHSPVEKPENKDAERDKPDKSGAKPPGQFVSDELEEQTKRFIEEVKGLARRRKEVEAEDRPRLPPPRSGGGQRPRRR
jgi:hypothetical protein